jgi:cell division septal protein FtsQ
VLCCAVLCCVVFCCVVLCCVVLCCVVLYCVVLCCVVLGTKSVKHLNRTGSAEQDDIEVLKSNEELNGAVSVNGIN